MTQLAEIYHLENYIDTFAPGHYARVLDALDYRTGQSCAFKVMRSEHLTDDGEMKWEYRAFGNEVQIFQKLADSPHVVKLLDCGFVLSAQEAPLDAEVVSLGRNTEAFVHALPEHARNGWRPYLALENMPRTDNLFYLMRPAQGSTRRRLPSEEGLTLALQFTNLLRLAHSQKIVYLDHKLEHIYWDGSTLRVIDFNSSQQITGSAATLAQEFAKDVHNMCVGVLYPIFTGMSPRKTSLIPQPGNLEAMESRYQDIRDLDFMMEPSLSPALQDLLQRAAAMQILTLDEFSEGLQQVAARHGRDFPAHNANPANRAARDKLRSGLKLLREGEARLRQSRDLFRDAAVTEGVGEDMEDELRRLVKAINELLNHRVLP
jgi:serine/threonine protein kinase